MFIIHSDFDNYISDTLDTNLKLKIDKNKSDLPSNAWNNDEYKKARNVLKEQFLRIFCQFSS